MSKEKQPKVRKPKKDRNIGKFFLALGTAIVIFVVLLVIQTGITNKYEKVPVAVAKTDIAAGTDITEDNYSEYVTIVDYDVTKVPSGYVSKTDAKEKLIDSITIASLPKGQVITDSVYAENNSITGEIASLADGDLVETSFSSDAIADAVAGTLRRGDVITVIVYDAGVQHEGEEELHIQKYTLENIRVKQAYDGSGIVVTDDNTEVAATMFDIIADQDDVDMLNELLLRKASGSRIKMTIVKTNNVAF